MDTTLDHRLGAPLCRPLAKREGGATHSARDSKLGCDPSDISSFFVFSFSFCISFFCFFFERCQKKNLKKNLTFLNMNF
jgi:hypothetical protein